VTWYFAYGSNLWIDQMATRAGPLHVGSEPPRIARLFGYRFAFNMRAANGQVFANIMHPGSYVVGVLYWCSPDALEKLDAFEIGYRRVGIEVVADTGETTESVAYVANPENVIDGGTPSVEYVERILLGGRQHGLPEEYLREIERSVR
jgi:cation transport regulator ChaC